MRGTSAGARRAARSSSRGAGAGAGACALTTVLDYSTTLPALASIALLGSVVYGLTGFGAALVTIPLATHFVPLPFALAVFALMDLGNALRIGLQRPKDANKEELIRMVPMVLAGTVVGVTALVNLPRAGAMLALGVFVMTYACYSLLRRPGGAMIRRGWAYLAGFIGGITSTLFGAGGPPYAIYLSHRPLSKEQFRATLTLTTLFSIGMRVVAFALTGLLLRREVLLAALAVLPGASAFIGLEGKAVILRAARALAIGIARRDAGIVVLVGAGLVRRLTGRTLFGQRGLCLFQRDFGLGLFHPAILSRRRQRDRAAHKRGRNERKACHPDLLPKSLFLFRI